jgi:hypothetical protein
VANRGKPKAGMRRLEFLVSLDAPDVVPVEEVREMIWDAVGTHPKSYCPDEAIFDCDADSVRVKRVNSTSAKGGK